MIVGADGNKLPFHNVITSFNETGYKRYGKAFVDSFLKYWPRRSVRLNIFYEGEEFEFTEGASWIPMESVEHLPPFMRNLRFPIMQGIVADKHDMWFDARQCRKVFMEMYALKKWGGKIFWMDSDCITHSEVPEGFLDEMLPNDKFCCYLGRDGWYHTESGFIGFNGDHPTASRFYGIYINSVISGAFLANQVHGRPGWNDCCVFDAVRHLLGNGPEFLNLAQGLPAGTMHPFINTVLGKYIDHLKGPRKGSNRSPDKDLVVHRDEPHWNEEWIKPDSSAQI